MRDSLPRRGLTCGFVEKYLRTDPHRSRPRRDVHWEVAGRPSPRPAQLTPQMAAGYSDVLPRSDLHRPVNGRHVAEHELSPTLGHPRGTLAPEARLLVGDAPRLAVGGLEVDRRLVRLADRGFTLLDHPRSEALEGRRCAVQEVIDGVPEAPSHTVRRIRGT